MIGVLHNLLQNCEIINLRHSAHFLVYDRYSVNHLEIKYRLQNRKQKSSVGEHAEKFDLNDTEFSIPCENKNMLLYFNTNAGTGRSDW